MRSRCFALPTLTCLGALLAGPALAAIVVTGPVDQADFQALVDAAAPGDTIRCLGGVYDFSAPGPLFIDKGLKIVAASSSDPPRFVGDGSIGTDPETGNNGFVQVEGSFIDGLTLKGLHLEDFDRAIALGRTNDNSVAGCPLIPGAGGRNVKIVGNTVRDARRGIQIFGGPFDNFMIKGNDVEFLPVGGSIGITAIGDLFVCEAGGLVDAVRLSNGRIQDNVVTNAGGAGIGILALGVENALVEGNHVDGGFVGVYTGDAKASTFVDDGPIASGSVKENVIEGAFLGVLAEGPTTLSGAAIKDNQISDTFVAVLLQGGANHLDVKANTFSASVFADVYLGLDEGGGIGEPGPDTFDNKVKVSAADVVLDFGVGNEVKVVD